MVRWIFEAFDIFFSGLVSILRLNLIGRVEEILFVCWIWLDLEAGRRNKDLKV